MDAKVYSQSITKMHGCTSFTIVNDTAIVMGRNLDVDTDFGYVFINPRGLKKTAYLPPSDIETPASWTAKYGSITFNQISKDIPHGGMNEEGLVVEHLFLAESQYPLTDERPSMISHQWVQYILDNCKNIDELIAINSKIRISNTEFKFPIHYHIMDKEGDRAIIEFLNDSMVVHRGLDYQACALANSTYEDSMTNMKNYDGWGGIESLPKLATESLDRFTKAADMAKNLPNSHDTSLTHYCYDILDAVRNSTQWQIVYDVKNAVIYYRTESNKSIRTLTLNQFDFNELDAIDAISMADDPSNNSQWIRFSIELNRKIIESICNQSVFINAVLGDEKEAVASHCF